MIVMEKQHRDPAGISLQARHPGNPGGDQAAQRPVRTQLADTLNLLRVSAPLFVRPETGLNDNLNGVERPVDFAIRDLSAHVEVVQSLAKWKRMALAHYGFKPGEGLYTDMNAIRRDETLDNLHSVYVDQWDWEKIIRREERTRETLERIVRENLPLFLPDGKPPASHYRSWNESCRRISVS
jgi:aspartate--ammonia ligase